MAKKAGFFKHGNVKLGRRVWSFSKLFGSRKWYVKKLNAYVEGTCGDFCRGVCEGSCYVAPSYRYPSVIYGHAVNTIAMREDMTGLFTVLDGQLNRAKKTPDIVRINQSGELESRAEFIAWLTLAGDHPGTAFYLYTKAFKYIVPALEAGVKIPDNFTILFSVWHEHGQAEYKQFSSLEQIKAFVYMDGYNYAADGLRIGTYCEAYRNGKLNHDITCDKCKKCFSRRAGDKIIGCNNH